METKPLQDILATAKTGDILLMHGDSEFQKIIDLLTGSVYNHIAMVVLAKDLGMKSGALDVLLWESTPFTFTNDRVLQKPKTGPTLVELKQRITDEQAHGTFTQYVFRNLNQPFTPEQINILKKEIKKAYPAHFPSTFWFFVKAILGRIFSIGIKQKKYFCSELVAETWQTVGILNTNLPSEHFAPKDFSEKGKLQLKQGYALGFETTAILPPKV
jgi:hypothetical protein